jgi:hypothetical protein
MQRYGLSLKFIDSVYGKYKRISFNVQDYGHVLWMNFKSEF